MPVAMVRVIVLALSMFAVELRILVCVPVVLHVLHLNSLGVKVACELLCLRRACLPYSCLSWFGPFHPKCRIVLRMSGAKGARELLCLRVLHLNSLGAIGACELLCLRSMCVCVPHGC